MKAETEVLVELAEGDFRATEWLLQSPDPLPRTVGFSAQQCVEKYLKVVAEEAGRPTPRIHDLGILLDRVVDLIPGLAPLRAEIATMVPFAAEHRYLYDAGLFPDIDEDAAEAAATMRTVRSVVRAALGLSSKSSSGEGRG